MPIEEDWAELVRCLSSGFGESLEGFSTDLAVFEKRLAHLSQKPSDRSGTESGNGDPAVGVPVWPYIDLLLCK